MGLFTPISDYEETFAVGFFEKYYALLYETLKSTLDTPIFRGEFQPFNGLHGKKNYVLLTLGVRYYISTTITYNNSKFT